MIMSAKIYIYAKPLLYSRSIVYQCRQMGVDVHLMIPCKPDHPFVYWATFSYAAELLNSGVKIYTYQNGFIHSKVMMIDDEICSVGSANMDYRSFALNFEVNAFMMKKSLKKSELHMKMTLKSKLLTFRKYNNRSLSIKVKEDIAKLVSQFYSI